MTFQSVPTTTSTILPGAPLPTGAQAPSTDPFDMAAVKAWILAEAQDTAYRMNTAATVNYLSYAFPNWLLNYQKTGDYTMTPPQPSSSIVVQLNADWWNPQMIANAQPVCSIPAYTKLQPPSLPGTVAIGERIGATAYWRVLPADEAPDGYETPAPVTAADGVIGLFRRIWGVPAPGGWYLKIG